MTKEEAKTELIEVLTNQVVDLTMMSKIELGDDVIAEIKRLKDIINGGTYNWTLVREKDGLTKQSKDIKWIEWDENGLFEADHEVIGIGRSLIMSPFNQYFTWQTTQITEILEEKEHYIKFKTLNSTYELFKLV